MCFLLPAQADESLQSAACFGHDHSSSEFGAVVILLLGRLLSYYSLECAKMDTG
jgi:hypothetical protein